MDGSLYWTVYSRRVRSSLSAESRRARKRKGLGKNQGEGKAALEEGTNRNYSLVYFRSRTCYGRPD